MIERDELTRLLTSWLQPGQVRDYCPNGLQVEGRAEIRKLVCAVTATESVIDYAIETGADALLVHHGYFWKSEPGPLTGMKKRRIAKLIRNDINLYAYHLPLDIHPELGNNAALAEVLQLEVEGREEAAGTPDLLWYGRLPRKMTVAELSQHVSDCLSRAPVIVKTGNDALETIAWCTGGAQGFIDQAALRGVDVYLSGEISEQTTHSAREQGVTYVSAGHHATERYGVQKVGEALARECGLEVVYREISNPA